MSASDFTNFSMLELFRIEADNQVKVLTDGLLILERDNNAPGQTEALMRAAHSIKGAARVVELRAAVRVAHAMEDCFVAAQKGRVTLGQEQIDLLLGGVDLLVQISEGSETDVARWENERKEQIDSFVAAATALIEGRAFAAPATAPAKETNHLVPSPEAPIPARTKKEELPPAPPVPAPVAEEKIADAPPTPAPAKESDRVLRVTADNLNRLLGLAGESLVESRHLNSFTESLLRLKRHQGDLARLLESACDELPAGGADVQANERLRQARHKIAECRQFLSERLTDLELFDRRSVNLSRRLYEEALACRMRPLADGVHGFPRMVRDVARTLGKDVRFEIIGEATNVDRDVLEKLEAPLTHLLRNAVDHGIETPEERARAGKPRTGLLQLEARHRAGMLQVLVTDDGRGIDPEILRDAIVKKKLTTAELAEKMSAPELFEFLFLPRFTLKETVTEISGRGVGLDVVRDMVKQVRGTVRIASRPGEGTRFTLQLPLTLSVARMLLVEIDGEPYAFPLPYVTRTLRLPASGISLLEGRQHFEFEGRPIGLITAHQILGRGRGRVASDVLPVIVVENNGQFYGVVVDRFLGERELVVHALDPRLGKVRDISAGALMEDGAPLLIIDVEDLVHSIGQIITGGPLTHVHENEAAAETEAKKRILIVEDSLTVRELERKLLDNAGYEVEVAVNGMDGWNAVRTGRFDLVISDIDMPRLDGIELVKLIRNDAHIRSLPVIVVSYKDREDDRRRGLEAGADYYMTKEGFEPDALREAVRDMIGSPTT